MYEFAYLIGIAYIFLLLLLLMVIVKKSRKLIFYSALIWAPAAPILQYWHLQDYWNPYYTMPIQFGSWKFGFEDFLLGAAVAGLCVGLFELLIKSPDNKVDDRINIAGLGRILILPILVGPVGMFTLSSLIGLNSVCAIVLLGFSTTTIVLIKRPSWVTPALKTGVVVMVVCWMSYYIFYLRLFPYIIDAWWHKDIIKGVSLGGVPIEELIWAMMSGLFCGPVSRFFLVSD